MRNQVKERDKMSKKLIAIAAAAALAITGLVATPASSVVGAFSIVVDGNSPGTGLNADAAYTVKIPTQDVLRFAGTAGATTSVFRIVSQTPGTTDTVRAVSTGGVKVLSAASFDGLTTTTNNTKAGSADVSVISVGGNATFYVYSTSTTAGTVTLSSGSNSQVIYVKGIDPAAYNVVAKASPATVATSADTVIDFAVTDAFGNAIVADQTVVITKVGPINLSTATKLTWDADRSTLYLTVSGSAAGNASVNVELGAANGATAITAFGTPKTSFFTVAVGGTQTELIAALTAQVAAQAAILAVSRLDENSVTQKKYNTLARKWNAAFPSQRVALKK
jgi:hypothetical protein